MAIEEAVVMAEVTAAAGEAEPLAEGRKGIRLPGEETSPFESEGCSIQRQRSHCKRGDMHIYVGNLSLETTADELRKEFTEFGVVLSVTIMNDKYIGSGQPRAYGYVEMASKSEGATAIANLEGRTLRNRIVNVVEALPLSDKGEPVSNIKITPLKRRGERKRQAVN